MNVAAQLREEAMAIVGLEGSVTTARLRQAHPNLPGYQYSNAIQDLLKHRKIVKKGYGMYVANEAAPGPMSTTPSNSPATLESPARQEEEAGIRRVVDRAREEGTTGPQQFKPATTVALAPKPEAAPPPAPKPDPAMPPPRNGTEPTDHADLRQRYFDRLLERALDEGLDAEASAALLDRIERLIGVG